MARTISGIVESDGDRSSGQGFSSNKVGNGAYMITFAPPFRSVPAVLCTPVSTIGESEVEHGLTVGSVAGVERGSVKIITGYVGGSNTVHPRDNAFSFVAIGD